MINCFSVVFGKSTWKILTVEVLLVLTIISIEVFGGTQYYYLPLVLNVLLVLLLIYSLIVVLLLVTLCNDYDLLTGEDE
jgi:hypothetical protein